VATALFISAGGYLKFCVDPTTGSITQRRIFFVVWFGLTLACFAPVILASILGMLLGVGRMLLGLGVVAFAVIFGGCAVRLRRVLMMLRCFVMLVSCHGVFSASAEGNEHQL
jgi:hypothetical protein